MLTSQTVRKAVRHSGLQKDVLSHYREWQRAIHGKFLSKPLSQEEKESQQQMISHVRSIFKQRAQEIPVREVSRVEYWLKMGKRQLKVFKSAESSGFTVMGSTNKPS
jgi:hypothetical protein